MKSEREKAKDNLEELKMQGLKGFSFFPGEPASNSEEFYSELNRILEKMKSNDSPSFKFNDSNLK